MLTIVNAVPAGFLLLAGVLGISRRRPNTGWVAAAALLAGVAAVALAVPRTGVSQEVRGYAIAVALVAAGAAATAVFRVGCALSARRSESTAIPIGGSVAVLQVLLIHEGNDGAARALAGTGPETHAVLLASITYLWCVIAAGTLTHAVGSVLRFLPSSTLRFGFRVVGVLTAVGLIGAAVFGIEVMTAPHDLLGDAVTSGARDVVLICVGLIGVGLLGARIQVWLRPGGRRARAALLHRRLRGFEQQLIAAAPDWRPTARVSVLDGPEGALYSRVMTIWDTSRALTTGSSSAVVAGSIDYAQQIDRYASPDRHAAVAEACLIHHALTGPVQSGSPRFEVLTGQDDGEPHSDIAAEGKFLCAVARVLENEQALLWGFRRYLDRTALGVCPAGTSSASGTPEVTSGPHRDAS